MRHIEFNMLCEGVSTDRPSLSVRVKHGKLVMINMPARPAPSSENRDYDKKPERMARCLISPISHLIATVSLILASGCSSSSSKPMIVARGVLANQQVRTTVDHEIAKYYLEEWLVGHRSRPDFDRRIKAQEVRTPGVPSREVLTQMAKNYSTDFAAMFLARSLMHKNRVLQHQFEQALSRANQGKLQIDAQGVVVLFAPGWFYQKNPETGADFREHRQRMSKVGIDNRLIPTLEAGSIEVNGQMIAEAIQKTAPKKTLVVSASKSGAEVALALGQLLSAQESAHVSLWLNIGGVIGGTPLADHACKFPRSVATTTIFWVRGWNIEGLGGMKTEVARNRLERLHFPKHLRIVNYLPIPLSGQITQKGRGGYASLAPNGPNDGLVLSADAMVPGRETIVAFGLDHFLQVNDIGDRALALFDILR